MAIAITSSIVYRFIPLKVQGGTRLRLDCKVYTYLVRSFYDLLHVGTVYHMYLGATT